MLAYFNGASNPRNARLAQARKIGTAGERRRRLYHGSTADRLSRCLLVGATSVRGPLSITSPVTAASPRAC
jgi:hypothetical protein